jgi:UDP-GlcNAc3NAcA epimerase
MIRILTVVGARPQFIKAAMVSRALALEGPGVVCEDIIHTGQHYDENMSQLFFDQMGLARPAARFEYGGLSHGAMTGRMLEALEAEIVRRIPDFGL